MGISELKMNTVDLNVSFGLVSLYYINYALKCLDLTN